MDFCSTIQGINLGIQIMRTDQNLLPQPTDLPTDSQLRKAIQEQITSATSPVNLASKASGSRFFDDAKRGDEFKLVAEAFQRQLSSAYSIHVGFLRDQFNQHELWLVPNDLFPSPPSDATGQSIWSFATARPLKNTLWTDDFVVPDFASNTSDVPNWKGYPLKAQHFVEQDFDELARSAFAFIEAEAFKPGIVTDPNNADLIRAALEAKERIADGSRSLKEQTIRLI